MKNPLLTIMAAVVLLSCNKKETTVNNTTTDSTMNSEMTDSTMMSSDSTAVSGTQTATTLSEQDKMFVDAAAKGGMMEVMMGEMAANNGTHSSVKSLGSTIMKDHTKANAELKSWASAAGYTLPTSLDASQQKKHDDLMAKKGAEFDKAYTQMMVEDHKKDIAAFRKQVSDGQDPSLKSFAEKTLPTLEKHLKDTEAVWNTIK